MTTSRAHPERSKKIQQFFKITNFKGEKSLEIKKFRNSN